MTDAALKELAALKLLAVYLRDTRVTDAGVKELQRRCRRRGLNAVDSLL